MTALPEPQWLWRRIYVFVASFGLWRLLGRLVERAGPEQTPQIAHGLMTLLALMLVLYLVAPTAQQLVALSANLRLRIAGGGRA